MKSGTREIIICGIFAAIISVFSVMTIPIGEVPVTMGLFGVMIAGVVLGAKRSVTAVIIYILIGAVGIPVFAGFKGGAAVIVGATGGYITSYIFVGLIAGFFVQFGRNLSKNKRIILNIAACFAGIIICYFLGTVQFMLITQNPASAAIMKCVLPFIPFDVIKAVTAAILGDSIFFRTKVLHKK